MKGRSRILYRTARDSSEVQKREKNHEMDMMPPDVSVVDLDTFWLLSPYCASVVSKLLPKQPKGVKRQQSFWTFLTGLAWALLKHFIGGRLNELQQTQAAPPVRDRAGKNR
jgi:hypothetical protein